MDEQSKAKKARTCATDFIEKDEVLLVQLVISVREVLINKKSDQFTNHQMNEQWKKLAVTFNAAAASVGNVCVFSVQCVHLSF